jgi:chromosome segregation protein
VFLRSITLKGFKSFADATTLDLEPGVAVVVGPNGSGKSNVVDAIAWVLGAQAPSAVRATRMDDVIFAGTATRPALGRAEVSLTVDNSAGLLPIAFSELTITRTLFRTGESEYALNAVPCRLLDVQELLSDVGVGRQQHVIVSQGQIDDVLNARPEDRRGIVEEAAGVLKYRKRKEKAERRLEATEGSLLRVHDLLREVRRQLRPLERQAEAARRHGELAIALSDLQVHLAGREIAAHRQRLLTTAAADSAAGSEEATVRAELARLDTAVAGAEAQLSAMGASDVGEALRRVEQLHERARGLAALVAERRRRVCAEGARLLDLDVVALAAEAEGIRAEQAEIVAARAGVSEDDQERAGAPDVGAQRAAAEVRGERRTLAASLAAVVVEGQRLASALRALDERIAGVVAATDGQRVACRAADERAHALVMEADDAEAAAARAAATMVAAEARLAAAEGERVRWAARAEALADALTSARARAGVERVAGTEGVLGLLADLVTVDAGWERAFEAAAGEALSAVIARSPAAARGALEVLAAAGATGAVMTARTVAPPGPAPVGQLVRPHVRAADSDVGRLLDVVLGAIVAVDGDWAAALDAVLAHPHATVVTMAGDRFGVGGWRLGAGGEGATTAAWGEATAALTTAGQAVVRCRADVDHAAEGCAVAQAAVVAVAARFDDADAQFARASEAVSQLQAERGQLDAERAAVAAAADAVRDRCEADRRRLGELDAALPALEADEQAAASRAVARHQASAQRAELSARATLLARRLEEIEARQAAEAERAGAAAHERAALADITQALDRLADVVDAQRAVAAARLADLQERRRREGDETRAVAEQLDRARRARSDGERQLEALRERRRRLEVDGVETRLRLEAAVELLRRDHDLEPEPATARPCPPLPEGTTPQGHVRHLERELRLLGPINPLALEEFTALKERHRFLEEQLDDVKATRRDLLRVIRAVDAEIEQVFAAAYADVSAHFEALFTRLFPGGAGRLILTTPEDLLSTGVEVEARPSGKNVKKLSLLSGGERSLVALAFLFAVFRSRPSPFYVMDEVEAALDDVNLHRFLALLEEFRAEAQLLVVSHQKRTMEAADCLFGVTMPPGGSSQVISERAVVPAR